MLFNQKVFRIYLFIILLITSWPFVIGQNEFNLQDINPHSDTYEQLIGPSYFSNNIIILGFFHEY